MSAGIQSDVVPRNDVRIAPNVLDEDPIAMNLTRDHISFAGVECIVAAIGTDSIRFGSRENDHPRATLIETSIGKT